MSVNKLRKLYTRKNCVHMCYKGKVFANHDVLPGGELVLSETAFTEFEKAYCEPNSDSTIIVTKADNSISEIWGVIDLNNLPRKNASTKVMPRNEYDGLTLEQLCELMDRKKREADELEKRRKGVQWYTISVAHGKKSTVKFHPTYGIQTKAQLDELKAKYKVNNIDDLSFKEHNELCRAAEEDFKSRFGDRYDVVDAD